ncbi:glycoside hydrolase family 43 protein [Ceratobasidium sp. AG-Ba]|nr:glycoside hydrolase family 43 protein [Ceratobasidium sp. AG-Ba]
MLGARLLITSLLSLGGLLASGRTIPPEFQHLQERQNTQYQGYGFVYFTGEDVTNGEQIYFAVSQGNDPLHWSTVNKGYAVLNSTLGTKGVRDPYIIRSPKNDKFYLIATDLRFASVNNWDTAGRTGSRSLAIWESPDLKTWSAQRLVQVSPATAGMTWAPEAVYDASTGHYIVFWASNLYAASDTNHTGASYSRIMYANTTDFKTFTPAQVYIDIGTAVIDTDVIYDAPTKTWHRFSKENGNIVQEKSSSFFGKWTIVTSGIGNSDIGSSEGPTVFLSNRYAGVYHLFVDDLSPRGYVPFETGNITSGVWKKSTNYALPTNPRHGTVFGITTQEMASLASL